MQPGDSFGPYVLEERLATGGMAEVFRARRVGAAGFARPVCIKRMLPTLSGDEQFVQMFIDEARTGSQLRHGNIVGIDDFGEVGGQFYLCMELVAGVDLSRLLRNSLARKQRLPQPAVAFAAHEVLRALDYAHRKVGSDGLPLHLVHRDVSPQNVLVSFAGEVKLTDFGIAKVRARLTQTVNHVVKGKLAYMSPEQARGDALDHRSDLFAVGVVLYELLAGRRPFVGATEPALVLALLRGDRPRLSALRPDVDPVLEAVVDRLLQGDVAARYESAGAVLEELSRWPGTLQGGRQLQGLMNQHFPGASSAASAPMAPPVDDASSAPAPSVKHSFEEVSLPFVPPDGDEADAWPVTLPEQTAVSPSPVHSKLSYAATVVARAPAPPVAAAPIMEPLEYNLPPPTGPSTLAYEQAPAEGWLAPPVNEPEGDPSDVGEVEPRYETTVGPPVLPAHWTSPPVEPAPVPAPEPIAATREQTAVAPLPVEERETSGTAVTGTMVRPASLAPPAAPAPAPPAQRKGLGLFAVLGLLAALGVLSAAAVYFLLPVR